MAKPIRNNKIALNGVSDKSQDAALKNVSEMKVGQKLELMTAGVPALFELIKIPAADIEKRTTVPHENARLQAALNHISLSDILETLNEIGQQYPARGYIDDKGMIEVWDGSRRRMSCILAEQDYYILVTKTQIDREKIRLMSDLGNVQKPLSLYEKGAIWETMLVDGKYEDAKSLAEGERVDPSIVTVARKAYSIPEFLIEKIPAIYNLGRPSINKICGLIKKLDDIQVHSKLKEIDVDLGSLSKEVGTENPDKLNAEFVKRFVAAFPTPPAKEPSEPKKTTDVDDQQPIAIMAIPNGLKKATMVDTDGKKAYIAEEGKEDSKTALIEVSGVPNDVLEDIFNFITERLGGAVTD